MTTQTHISNWRSYFIEVGTTTVPDHLTQRMLHTVENSPWHREANVKLHTDMVVNEYIALTDHAVGAEWSYEDYLGGMMCVWHDVGKPPCQTVKETYEDGSVRLSFHGHEQYSARMFANWAASTNDALIPTCLSKPGSLIVSWMIQHHMPWATTDRVKLEAWKSTLLYFGDGDSRLLHAFVRGLLADQYGRIADNQEAKNRAADEWAERFLSVGASQYYAREARV
jgi:hypothetical protein